MFVEVVEEDNMEVRAAIKDALDRVNKRFLVWRFQQVIKQQSLGKVSRKKWLFFWILSKWGEGPAQIVCPLFTNCIYWVNLGMGREGETPAQIFWHIGVQKKWYKLSKLGGGGVNVIWTKSKRTANFFRETVPNSQQIYMSLRI